MSDTSSYDHFADFLAAMRQRSAIRILELGTLDSSFSLAMYIQATANAHLKQ